MTKKLTTQKRIAAKILKVGVSRVWIKPDSTKEVASAMTSGDIRKYIGLGFIKSRPVGTASRGRFRKRLKQLMKGRLCGPGKRRGAIGTRLQKKKIWIKKIRAQRKILKELKTKGLLSSVNYQKAYKFTKSGTFKSKGHLLGFLKEQGFLKEAKEK